MSDDQQTLGNAQQNNELQLAQEPSGPSEPHQRPQSVSFQFESWHWNWNSSIPYML